MSNLLTRHPGSDQLLLYLDGELATFKARRIRRHVEACWECRAEIRELERTMADCVGYRRAVLQEHIPAPPQPWVDITREFARADRLEEKKARLKFVPAWSWAAAVAVGLVCILIYQLWRTPPVEAATLLKRAVAAEDTQQRKPHHVRIRTSKPQPLLRKADYNWDSPLSVQSYQAWRDGLPRKRDEVTTVEDRYRIRTTTDTGALAAATLTLRVSDLWPLEGRFEFRNHDWVEVTDAPEETPAPVAVTAAPERRAGIAPRAAPSVDHFPASAPEISGLGLELQVVAALHRAGADLGDPIEISRDGERILVAGTGIAPQRQKQIHSALDGLPNVVVRFSNPSLPPQADQSPAVPDTPADSQSARLQARIEAQLGGHAQFEKFSARLLDHSDAAMAQAYALRRLAREFSAETESGLDTKDRAVLLGLGKEHTTGLAGEFAELQRSLAPLIGADAERPHAAPANWQAAAEQVFDSTSHVEKLIAVYLGATPGEGPSADVPGSLAAGLARLQVDLNHCRRLLGR